MIRRRAVTLRPGALVAAALFALVIVGLPVIARLDPIAQDLSQGLQPPSWSHLLGTDQYGRDVAARLADGARRTLGLAVAIVAVAATLGIVVGLLTAAIPRRLRWIPDRLVDIALGLPALLVALAIVGALGPGQRNLMIALVVGVWPWYARLARDHAASVERMPFVVAARVGGIAPRRIWGTHIAPHVVRRLLVVAALDVGYTIVAFAGMSYLGLGVQPPTPELGVVLREGQDFVLDAPWLLWAPSAVVVLLVLPFVLFGERVHERGVIA